MAKQDRIATSRNVKTVPGAARAHCALRPTKPREFGPDVNLNRARLIRLSANKWVNGTVLHYWFFKQPKAWATTKAEEDVVRKAFEVWKNLGIGLEFKEVDSVDDAEVRIGFLRNDGAWSYIGREILNQGRDERTMNFGWNITQEIDTGLHEIGHTLGFPHEHQNPNAGIMWNEAAVYAALAQPPNNWDRATTYSNIIEKISPDDVQGSAWDPNSVMHYPFEAGLIKAPAKYQNGLTPAGGLSARDKAWVKTFYPALKASDYTALQPFKSTDLSIAAGQQMNFVLKPTASRYYEMRTFGTSDTVMVLFEDQNGTLRHLAADDDSGEDRNARIRLRLYKSRKYVLRVRLYYAERAGTPE